MQNICKLAIYGKGKVKCNIPSVQVPTLATECMEGLALTICVWHTQSWPSHPVKKLWWF